MSDAVTQAADRSGPSRSAGAVLGVPAEVTAEKVASGETAGRVRRSPGRALRHEATLASAAGLLLAVAMIWLVPPFAIWIMSAGETRPAIPDPVHTITGDISDPTAQAWILAWNGHAVLHDIGHLWRTNAFYPEKYPLAFSDSLLGYAPAGMIGSGMADAVLRYNVMLVLTFALASVGGYALARQLGANRVGAAIAGAAFAYAPWRYGHDGHLNILSTGGIALALAMLARGHGWSLTRGYRPEKVRPGWAIAGWAVAAWQVSLGFGIGLPFVYIVMLTCLAGAVGWLVSGRPPLPRRVVLADLGGGLAFTGACGYFAYHYLRVRALYPETERPWDYVAWFSPTLRGLFTAPRSSLSWGAWHESARNAFQVASNEKVLLCGYVLYGLAALGLVVSAWTIRQRVFLTAGLVVGVLLALGANGPLYQLLYHYLPGFDGSRTPGRLIVWPTLLLGLLAAGAVTELARRVRRAALAAYARTLVLAVTVPLLALVLAEGLPKMDHPEVPDGPWAAMAATPTPMIVLPSDEGIDLNVMLWSTDGFPAMVNGGSSITPSGHQVIRDLVKRFPSPDSVNRLRLLGIRGVVVDRKRVAGTPYERLLDAPTAGTGVTRRNVGADVVFALG
ncbi:hypothetical protein [Planosporangium flavigriseum]|nr:hypothetical protein [Planosporangium flavigriseum]